MSTITARFIFNVRTKEKAQRCFRRLRELVPIESGDLQPYHKGGFETCAKIDVPPGDWPTQVLFILRTAQKFGRGWTLSNCIDEEVDLSTAFLNIQGMEFASLYFNRNSQSQDAA